MDNKEIDLGMLICREVGVDVSSDKLLSPPITLGGKVRCELFTSGGMRRLDDVDGEPRKKRKRKSGKEADTIREFEEIEPKAEPVDRVGSDDDITAEEDDIEICL
ncbi:hypothetical protein Q3G72_016682 [Acer saccharum]|nr:hypothetical protein Q3G72_016682 [Acer saccharum]